MAQFYDSWRSGGLGRGGYDLRSRTTTEVSLTVSILTGQIANAFEIKNAAGTTIFSVSPVGNVQYTGSETVTDALTVTGATNLQSTLAVTGVTTLTGALIASSTATFNGAITINALSNFNGLLEFDSNATFTVGNHQIGRNGNSHLQYNVPLVQQHQFSVEGTVKMSISSTTFAVNNVSVFGGAMTVNGSLTVTGAVSLGNDLFIPDDKYLGLGNNSTSPDVRLGWNTSQTVDGLFLGLSDAQNTFVIAENGDRAFDFAHGTEVNPTLFIHSAAQTTTQFIEFRHTGTQGEIETGVGTLALQQRTVTPGAALNSVTVAPTYGAEGFSHTGLNVLPTQNGANATELRGINVTLTKATGATVLADAIALRIGALAVTGTVTNGYGIFIEDQSTAGGTISYGINIASQTANATTTRAVNIAGTGVNNAIRLGASANVYSSAAENIRFSDSTNVNGLDFNLLSTAAQTIRTLTATTGFIALQTNTFTAGAIHDAVVINPTWATENFRHTGLLISVAQNGANTQQLYGQRITVTKDAAVSTLATAEGLEIGIIAGAGSTITTVLGLAIITPTGGTIVTSNGIQISNQSLAGGTSAFAINIESQTANATTTRAIEVAGTGVNNAIRLGASPNIYSSAAQTIRLTDSTNANGLSFILAAGANQTINTISTTTGSIILQNQTFTAGAAHNVVAITPTWAAENFNHIALNITATQDSSNSAIATGIQIQGIKTTAAGTTLDSFRGIDVLSTTVTGTVTNNTGIYLRSQTGGSSNWGIYSDNNSLTWNFGPSHQMFLAATLHTLANVVNLDFDVNSASVNGIGIDGEVSTALSAAEIVNGISIDVDGNAADNATSQINGIALTSANTTTGANTGIRIAGRWDNSILVARNTNFTGADTKSYIDVNISPAFTFTEPAAGQANFYGLNIDLTGISVTAGAGTSELAALRLVANADADVGLNLALLVDSGTSRFDGNIAFGDETVDIGTSTVGLNDLHFGLGGIINFDGGDVTLTHAANLLTFAGGNYNFNGDVQLQSTVTTYGNVATAGRGVAAILASGQQLAVGTDGTTVAAYTAGATDELVEIGGFVEITAYTSGNAALALDYTTGRGTVVTGHNLNGYNGSNSLVNNLAATGHIRILPEIIAVNASSTVTLKTNTGAGTMTGDWYAYVKRIQ